MNKKILAIAISSLLATSAQAAMLYETDGTTVELYGDLEVLYLNDIAKSDSDQVIHIDDADFGFKMHYDIGNGLQVGGVMEVSGEGGNVTLGDAFVGVMGDFGELHIGKQATIYDDAGIGSDFQFGFESFYEQDVNSGYQVVKYTIDKGMFYGGIAYLMSTSKDVNTNESAIDGKIGVRVAGFDFTGFYGTADVTDVVGDTSSNTATHKVSNYTLEARYAIDALELAVTVAGTDDDNKSETGIAYGAAAVYSMDKTTFAAGVATNDVADVDEDVMGYYVNAAYAFSGNVKAYVELGGSDADDTELGYAAGMQVTF
jgi:predicted porin